MALGALAAQLPPGLLPDALTAAKDITNEFTCAEALGALAAQLPELLPDALTAAKDITDESARGGAGGVGGAAARPLAC